MRVGALSSAEQQRPLALAFEQRECRALADVDAAPLTAERARRTFAENTERAKPAQSDLAKTIGTTYQHGVDDPCLDPTLCTCECFTTRSAGV